MPKRRKVRPPRAKLHHITVYGEQRPAPDVRLIALAITQMAAADTADDAATERRRPGSAA